MFNFHINEFFGWKIDQHSHFWRNYGFLKNWTMFIYCCLSCFSDHFSINDEVGPVLWHSIKKKKKKKI